ncbi:hypothetical protein [Pseudoroseicyclus sp. CXY001]|uniref:hypothetical protein n=1 Tax=Pseudoroseicyclus sp. CXY001 TaxID=3242492 RepID=UPI00358DADED
MTRFSFLAPLLALPALAACSSTPPAPPTPVNDVIDTGAIADAGLTLDMEAARIAEEVDMRGDTMLLATVLPTTGSGDYAGEFTSVVNFAGGNYSTISGDTAMQIAFDSGAVSGAFTPTGWVDFDSSGSPFGDGVLSGSLAVDAMLDGSTFEGTLSGDFGVGASTTGYTIDADLDGGVAAGAGGLLGTFTGEFTGTGVTSPVGGVYYAE